MRFRIVYFSFLCLVAMCFVGYTREGHTQSTKQNNAPTLPAGAWTFSAHPDMRPESNSFPARLSSVTNDASKGLAVTSVKVLNRSAKPIAALRIHWRLTTEADQKTPLLQDETVRIATEKPIGAKEERAFIPLLPSFAQMAQSLPKAKGDELSGNYHLWLVVSEVIFDDGEIWRDSEGLATQVLPKSEECCAACPS